MSAAREQALAALRAWSAPGRRSDLVAAAWNVGATNVRELAEAARVGSRQTIYEDLKSRGIDPRNRPKEHAMPTPVVIEGLTGTDTEADNRTIESALDRYQAEHPGDARGLGAEESRLVRLGTALELYNTRAPAAGRETDTRRERDRALHLVETRWDALDAAPTNSWAGAHHQYVKAVHAARDAIAEWKGAAELLWATEGLASPGIRSTVRQAYETEILAAGHPDIETVQSNPIPEAERLLEELDTAHARREAIAAETLQLVSPAALSEGQE